MTRFYIRYTPVRSGLTGMEMLPQYLDQYFPNVEFTGVVKDGLLEYGYLEGTGDKLSQVLQTCGKKFSIKEMTEEVFIGFCYPLYNPSSTMDDEPAPPTFSEMMSNHGITVPADVLPNVRKAKTEEFKEITKKQFNDWNDSVADVAKAAMLLNLYDDTDLTSDQITTRDTLISRIKAVYTTDVCLGGLNNMVDLVEQVLVPYSVAKSNLESASTLQDILDVVYK